MKSPNLNREQLNDLKELLTERMVDNMSTKDLAEYVADDLFNYFDKLGEHEFLDEAKNYWDDMFDEIIEDVKEFEQCDFKKTIDDKREEYLDSLSEGKDLDDYGSKVDALVDSMSVTDEEVSTVHRRKDLDSL